MQSLAHLNFDKKYCKTFIRSKQLPGKGLFDNRCHAFEAVPEHRAIYKLNVFYLQQIKSECKNGQFLIFVGYLIFVYIVGRAIHEFKISSKNVFLNDIA